MDQTREELLEATSFEGHWRLTFAVKLGLLSPCPSPPMRRRGEFVLGTVYPGWRAEALTPGYYLEPANGVLEWRDGARGRGQKRGVT